MAHIDEIDVVDGIPTAGTGTVYTIDKLVAAVGEVQASPTSNTMLDRLKTIDGHVDGIEGLLGGTLTVTGTVTITDGSGPITVDGTVAATQSGTWNVGTVTTVTTVSSVTNIVNGNLTTVASVTNLANGNLTAITTLGTITNNVKAVGPTAADAALTVAPVTVGGLAKTSLPTAVGDGNVTNTLHSKYGQLIARLALRENQANQYTAIGNTTETTIITADASNKLDITGLTFTADAAVSITIRDDTGGTIKDKYTLQGNTTGGFVSSALPKLIQTTANKPWTAQLSGTANVTVSATYTKAGA